MTWNVLSGVQLHPAAHEVFDGFAELTIASDYKDEAALTADLDRFDAMVSARLSIPRERIERATELKVIASRGVGLDPVDVGAATDHGVIVCNNPGANTRAVAEYTMAAMLATRRRLREADRDLRAGIWEKHGYLGPEVEGQTMAVLGYGAIGRLVCRLAQGLDMETVAYDPYVEAETMRSANVEPIDHVETLFERADAASIHAPLTDETRGIVGKTELEALGSDGVLVNAARGGLVDEEALVDALAAEVIAGAAIDVFEEEPAPDDHPLFELENVIVTPHIAGSTNSSVPAKARGAAVNIKSVHDGHLPPSTVNRDALCLRAAFGADQADALGTPDPF